MDSVGYYIMIALLGAGAAYGLANKGKPRPGVSSTSTDKISALEIESQPERRDSSWRIRVVAAVRLVAELLVAASRQEIRVPRKAIRTLGALIAGKPTAMANTALRSERIESRATALLGCSPPRPPSAHFASRRESNEGRREGAGATSASEAWW